jgi:hypothetical protein
MNRKCHETVMQTWRRRQLAISDLLRHAKIVTDPTTLEHLNAKVAKRDAATEGELRSAGYEPVSRRGRVIRCHSQFGGVR